MKSPPWQNKSREHVRSASFCMGCVSPSSTALLEITSVIRRNRFLMDGPDTRHNRAGGTSLLGEAPGQPRTAAGGDRPRARGGSRTRHRDRGSRGGQGRAAAERTFPARRLPARRRPALSLPTPGGSSRRGGAGAAGPLLPPGPRGALRAGPTRPCREGGGCDPREGGDRPSYPALPTQPCLSGVRRPPLAWECREKEGRSSRDAHLSFCLSLTLSQASQFLWECWQRRKGNFKEEKELVALKMVENGVAKCRLILQRVWRLEL